MENNTSFCYAPWNHLYINPDSKLMPCCIYTDRNEEFADLNEVSLEEAYNHPRMIEIRKELIDGKVPAGCFRCEAQIKIGMGSYRSKMNSYGKVSKPEIKPDGTVDPDKIKPDMLDIRFGNLCNLKCRTCSPTYSSSIAVEHNKMYPMDAVKILYDLKNTTVDKIFEKLDGVKHIYIAGGEPLIEENNYVLLERLIKTNLKPTLLYNTNLTNINFKDKNLVELLSHFPSVEIIVSLDGYGEVNDYIRSGSNYNEILENMRYLKEKLPNIVISVNSVASVLSMESLPDLVKDLISKRLVDPIHMMFGICHYPVEQEITVFTPETKELIKKKFDELYIWILKNAEKPKECVHYLNKCRGIVKHMLAKDDSHLLPKTIEKLTILDKVRDVDYRKVIKNL